MITVLRWLGAGVKQISVLRGQTLFLFFFLQYQDLIVKIPTIVSLIVLIIFVSKSWFCGRILFMFYQH